MARIKPEINAGSMADIAFLLLIFFLVTTTINIDTGIVRRLPPLPETNQSPIKVNKRNIFEVLINSQDQLLIDGKPGDVNTLKNQIKSFISNKNNDSDLPQKQNLTEKLQYENITGNFDRIADIQNAINIIGDYPVSAGIISLQNDRATSYEMYIKVQNEITAAFRELRDELSFKRLGIKYTKLKDQNKIRAIEEAIPMNISEAEPENSGEI